LLFLQEFENSAERQPTFLKTTLEICHGEEMHWVEGVQWMCIRGSWNSKKGILKHKKGHKCRNTATKIKVKDNEAFRPEIVLSGRV